MGQESVELSCYSLHAPSGYGCLVEEWFVFAWFESPAVMLKIQVFGIWASSFWSFDRLQCLHFQSQVRLGMLTTALTKTRHWTLARTCLRYLSGPLQRGLSFDSKG
jgi:hypothetical protein